MGWRRCLLLLHFSSPPTVWRRMTREGMLVVNHDRTFRGEKKRTLNWPEELNVAELTPIIASSLFPARIHQTFPSVSGFIRHYRLNGRSHCLGKERKKFARSNFFLRKGNSALLLPSLFSSPLPLIIDFSPERKGGISRFESNFNSFRDERRLAVILGCFWSIFFSKTGNRFFNYRFCSRMRDHRSCSDDWNLNDRSATSIITKERAIDPPTWNIVDLIVSQIHLLNDTYNFLYSWM